MMAVISIFLVFRLCHLFDIVLLGMDDERLFKMYIVGMKLTTFSIQTQALARRPVNKMIEITCNDRLGKKVRVKCKYPLPSL